MARASAEFEASRKHKQKRGAGRSGSTDLSGLIDTIVEDDEGEEEGKGGGGGGGAGGAMKGGGLSRKGTMYFKAGKSSGGGGGGDASQDDAKMTAAERAAAHAKEMHDRVQAHTARAARNAALKHVLSEHEIDPNETARGTVAERSRTWN